MTWAEAVRQAAAKADRWLWLRSRARRPRRDDGWRPLHSPARGRWVYRWRDDADPPPEQWPGACRFPYLSPHWGQANDSAPDS